MDTVSDKRLSLKQIKSKLASLSRDVNFSFPGKKWPNTHHISSAKDWLGIMSASGLDRSFAYRSVAEAFGLHKKEIAECDSEQGFWLEHGFQSLDSGIFYHRQFYDDMVGSSSSGLLIPSSRDNYTESSQSKNHIHMESAKLLADMERDIFSPRGVKHVVLRSGVLGFCVGAKTYPYKKLETAISGSINVESIADDVFFNCWSESINKCIEHLTNRKKGRLCFLSGDYTDLIPRSIEKTIRAMTMLRVYTGVPEESQFSNYDVFIIDNETFHHQQEAVRKLYKSSKAYLVLSLDDKNITSLLTSAQLVFTLVDLTLDWGAHSIRVAVPKICGSCKREVQSNDLTVDLVNFTRTFERSSSTGFGCSSCVNGYEGFVFASEDIWGASVFSSILLEAISDQEESDKISELAISPYKIANDLYKKESVLSLATSLVSLISSGLVNINDAQDVLG